MASKALWNRGTAFKRCATQLQPLGDVWKILLAFCPPGAHLFPGKAACPQEQRQQILWHIYLTQRVPTWLGSCET